MQAAAKGTTPEVITILDDHDLQERMMKELQLLSQQPNNVYASNGQIFIHPHGVALHQNPHHMHQGLMHPAAARQARNMFSTFGYPYNNTHHTPDNYNSTMVIPSRSSLNTPLNVQPPPNYVLLMNQQPPFFMMSPQPIENYQNGFRFGDLQVNGCAASLPGEVKDVGGHEDEEELDLTLKL